MAPIARETRIPPDFLGALSPRLHRMDGSSDVDSFANGNGADSSLDLQTSGTLLSVEGPSTAFEAGSALLAFCLFCVRGRCMDVQAFVIVLMRVKVPKRASGLHPTDRVRTSRVEGDVALPQSPL
ncbi:hypothetical protein Naga_100023g8 [Nannochloropsis gaditana]|uniref:Uncharacterized protein n=1 Tax=Nannochloropsis gaditana TaxID=72520 RepID=W7T8A3_9STRA|nr:hypothetical protein Naga_100023g8 [Nannochloropsis gaditana]